MAYREGIFKMEFKIGQKVNTPSVGVIKYYMGGKTVWVTFNENMAEIELDIKHLKPHKTAHERLLEMGYECYETLYSGKQYINIEEDEALPVEINIDTRNKCYYIPDNDCVNLELSRILTDYLEELKS